MNLFVLAVFSFLAVVGLVELIRKLTFWFLRPIGTTLYISVPLKSADEAEMTVRSLLERIRWMGLKAPIRLIFINCSESEELQQIVRKLICNFPNVTLLSASDMYYNDKKD